MTLTSLEFQTGKNSFINKKFPNKIIEEVYELAVSQYSTVRSWAQDLLQLLTLGDIQTVEKIVLLLEKSLKPGLSHHEFKGALYILANKDFLRVFHSWKNASILYPALVQASHSDKVTVVEQLKIISDYALWTMSFKPAKMTEKIARSLGYSKPWQGNSPNPDRLLLSIYSTYFFTLMLLACHSVFC